jgi:hypothetical protein
MKIVCIVAAVATIGSPLRASTPPRSSEVIVEAAEKVGLLSASDFVEKTLNEKEMESLKVGVQRNGWVADIPGLKEAILRNDPAVIGIHKESGFRVAVYYSGDDVMLLVCNVPLVNGSSKEGEEMIETMLSVSESLVGKKSGVRRWLDKEWKISWGLSAQEGVDPHSIIRKKVFGPFLVSVWGAAPDIVFLNCVRVANQLPDPTSKSVTPPAKAGGAPSSSADH